MIRIASFALVLLAGCSESTGVPEVDRARDAIQAEVGTTPAMRHLGDTAMAAARRAERAGQAGDAGAIGSAIGTGSVEVLCAGTRARADSAGTLADSSTRALPGGDAVRRATDTVRSAAARLPDVNPCPKPRS